MDRYHDNSQLLREAKIGFSIVLLVVSTVGYWGYCTYHRFRTQIPDHVIDAPLAQMVGPDDYLRSLEGRPPRIAANERLATPLPSQSNPLPPTLDTAARQVTYDQPVNRIEKATTKTLSAATLPKTESQNQASHGLTSNRHLEPPQSDLQTAANSFLTDMKRTMERVEAVNPLGKPGVEVNNAAHRSPQMTGRKQDFGQDQFQPLRAAKSSESVKKESEQTEQTQKSFHPLSPLPLDEISSNDNVNIANTAKDVSVDFVSKAPAAKVPDAHPTSFEETAKRTTDTADSTFTVTNGLRNSAAKANESESQMSEQKNPAPTPLAIDRLRSDDIVVEIEEPNIETLDSVGGDRSELIATSVDEPTGIEEMAVTPEATQDAQAIGRNTNGSLYQCSSGESWWSIATKFYDDGRYFRALFHHNQSAGVNAAKIVAGIQIEIPTIEFLHENYRNDCPADKLDKVQRPSDDSDLANRYTTAQGDTLFGIAREVTGQASKYLEIHELNRERLPARINHLTRLPANIVLIIPR